MLPRLLPPPGPHPGSSTRRPRGERREKGQHQPPPPMDHPAAPTPGLTPRLCPTPEDKPTKQGTASCLGQLWVLGNKTLPFPRLQLPGPTQASGGFPMCPRGPLPVAPSAATALPAQLLAQALSLGPHHSTRRGTSLDHSPAPGMIELIRLTSHRPTDKQGLEKGLC